MKTKRILAALLLAAVLLLPAACGKKQTASAEPAPEPERAVAEEAASGEGSIEPALTPAPALMPAPTAEPALTPAPTAEPAPSATPAAEPALTPAPTAEPAPTVPPAAEPAPTVPPTAEPVPPPVYDIPAPEAGEDEPRPGVYTGSDESVLTVQEDGSCTYETELSGKLNGKSMTASVTFHGTVAGGVFTFDKITYGALDLTALAAAAGYTDASPWEAAAAIIYGGQ